MGAAPPRRGFTPAPHKNEIINLVGTYALILILMSLLPPLRKVLQDSSQGIASLEVPSNLMVKDVKELFGQLSQEQNKIQELLSSLGYALRSFSNLHQFLELIPLIASRVNDADGAILIVFKSNGQVNLESLHCSDYASTNGLAIVKPQQLRRTLEQEIQHVLASSVDILDQLVNRALGIGANVFSTPILVKNFIHGRLYVFSYKPDYTWSPNRQQLIRLVADQAAVGIENNALAAELLKKERQDRELEIGAEIQRQLLPRNCPEIHGAKLAAKCLTADRVGGDYYDFIPVSKSTSLPDGCWSIVIGDVMGKGVPAGLIMTMTRGMLRAEVLNGHSPGKILEHLNQIMYDDLEKSHRFVTMFYSEYDPKTQILSYSNAAHLPALLRRSQTKTIHSLDTLGALIGLEAGSIYDQNHVQLYPGDIVIYYTDGFTEAANTMGDRFDEENLRLYLQKACQKCDQITDSSNCPQGILDFIYEGVQSFIGQGRSHSDDMTLIVMQIE